MKCKKTKIGFSEITLNQFVRILNAVQHKRLRKKEDDISL